MNFIQRTARPNSDFERGSEVVSNRITLRLIVISRLLFITVLLSIAMSLLTIRAYYGEASLHQLWNYGRAAFWREETPTGFGKDYSLYVIHGKAYQVNDQKAYEFFRDKYFAGRPFQ